MVSAALTESGLAAWSRPWSEEANQTCSLVAAPTQSLRRRIWRAAYDFLFEFNKY